VCVFSAKGIGVKYLIRGREVQLRQVNVSLLPVCAIDDGRVFEVDQNIDAQL